MKKLSCGYCGFQPVAAVESVCCNTLFCERCAEGLETSCPGCNAPWSKTSYVANWPIRHMLSESGEEAAPVNNKPDNGCKWKCGRVFIDSKALSTHEEHCSLALTLCPNSELCGILTKGKLPEHLEKCEHRQVKCVCGEDLLASKLDEHKLASCRMALVDCSACAERVLRADLSYHQSTECKKAPVACRFGCAEPLTKDMVQQHESEAIVQHLEVLNKRMHQLESTPAHPSAKMFSHCSDFIAKQDMSEVGKLVFTFVAIFTLMSLLPYLFRLIAFVVLTFKTFKKARGARLAGRPLHSDQAFKEAAVILGAVAVTMSHSPCLLLFMLPVLATFGMGAGFTCRSHCKKNIANSTSNTANQNAN